MSWKVRHEGSPESTANLTLEQVMQGLLDGRWEPTDEVLGPQDATWVALENHPQFAEIAADIEPPQPRPYDDETRVDMTALIDVCLVLLIFFILTTTYANLQKIMDAANLSAERIGGARIIKEKDVLETMIRVDVKQVGDDSVIEVEKKKVALDDLLGVLRGYSGAARRRTLLLSHDRKVPHGVIVRIQDDARQASMDKVFFLLPSLPPPRPQ